MRNVYFAHPPDRDDSDSPLMSHCYIPHKRNAPFVIFLLRYHVFSYRNVLCIYDTTSYQHQLCIRTVVTVIVLRGGADIFLLQAPSFNALVGFPSRTAADEFWRAVQESPNNNPQDPEACRRYNPQFMRIPAPWIGLRLSGWDAPCTVQLLGGNLGHPGLVAPSQSHPDNINGRGFYIRSATRPNLFWHLYQKRLGLTLSSTHQTRFIVRRTTPLPFSCRPEEDILIGKDDINIFLFFRQRSKRETWER
ncbi:hypothetical protein P691DRAFT_304842 [Macrolepiota fuliginosa MF-IS2]|uniref:Uncharacterized protein n=1 Tax=Macrolepiota fuliginosa MF-IS2 TaxID=1400762 RepID=A0A9P6BZ09_9AGAR|nr:hypothetical protein P691DRAFT_304842 [Macrolepiota fuliginosa MF-IS2]